MGGIIIQAFDGFTPFIGLYEEIEVTLPEEVLLRETWASEKSG